MQAIKNNLVVRSLDNTYKVRSSNLITIDIKTKVYAIYKN